jgi:cell division cycle 20-like protein 1 (cofactor of APC complex)
MLDGYAGASASGTRRLVSTTTVTTTTTRDGTTMNNANGTTTIAVHGVGGGGGGGTGTTTGTNGGGGEDGRGNRRTGEAAGHHHHHHHGGNNGGHEREEASAAYGALLRSGLLGDASPPEAYGVTPPSTPLTTTNPSTTMNPSTTTTSTTPSTASPSPFVVSTSYSSPGKNLFRFRADGSFGVARESPFTLSPVASLLENQPLYAGGGGGVFAQRRRAPRKIPRSPFKVLDAPALQDDFYLNLVDWSSSNILAVGLGTSVYLWSACTSKVTKLCELAPQQDSVCSVAWTQRGTYLGVGTNSGEVQIWDVAKCKLTRTMRGHRSRAGTLAWNSHTISSGSRDRSILNRDVRSASDYSSKLLGHKSEVCGLKWSYDEGQLASGGNDNQLFVWNAQSTSPALRCSEHTAAVKAIAWSPHQHGLLASGGGTADRCIRFWTTVTNAPLQCVDTGSQVCNLEWSKNVNEIVSTHGYSQNQIVVWRYPSMSKLTTLTGHTYRVLYLAVSPDGQTIVTGAGDETLRFWNVFPGPKSQVSGSDNAVSSLARAGIR